MPRPRHRTITFEIDGREVQAPEGQMLVDAAKSGDVEIPYFCYEPRLGQPVGACRMCLVEIEGMPKLQTACSTPVKDGMVVVTTSDRVKHAQNAVVEFLLVNHPLDCPVCDKGGECPLQDISYGWGPGRSRFIEPKRHFRKPLELSPLVAIDRERCILCYRCVRFSQEVAEDHQLVFLERGDHTYVGTHHGHPYVAPFSGNIIELCPVGALTSTAYRFRARPWDIEGAGSVCTLCPAQCNIEFTVRDDMKVLRVITGGNRHNEGVEDGWLCDKGRFGYQTINSGERILGPIVREGGALLERSWDYALSRVADALKKAGASTALIAGGETTNEEAFLAQRLIRDALGSADLDSRTGALDAGQARVLARPDLTASVPDVEFAGAVLVVETELVDEMPVLELRVRKGRRRHGVQVAIASSHPSALDRDAVATVRFAPGAGEALLAALASALGSDRAPGTVPAGEERREGTVPAGEERREGTVPAGAPHSHGDPVGSAGEVETEPDPGAPAPVTGPEGMPGAEAGGGAGEQSAEGGSEAEARTPDVSARTAGAGTGSRSTAEGSDPSRRGASDSRHESGSDPSDPLDDLARRAGADAGRIRALADLLREAGSVVIVWGERLSHGPRGKEAVDALLAVASALDLGGTEGSGLLEVPSGTNSRGLREAGVLPNLGPGLADAATTGRGASEIAGALAEGEVAALVLLHADPLATHPNSASWEAGLEHATFAVAFADFLDGAVADHADVILPAESYAEREGTVTHPDGRVQRVRQAIGHPGDVRPVWWALEQILDRLGKGTGARTAPMVSEQLFETVPFYAGLTLEEIGGRGVRWQDREAASKLQAVDLPSDPLSEPPEPAEGEGLRLGVRPSLWSGRETRHAPVLRFLRPTQTVEVNPADAKRLSLVAGEPVTVAVNGTRVNATVEVRAVIPEGTAYLIEGADDAPANVLVDGGAPQRVEVRAR
jgi:NADH-quinone oxidoreductase chain G